MSQANISKHKLNTDASCGIILDDISDHIKKLNDFLSLQNWQSVYNGSNVNESHNNFVGIFITIYLL